MQGFTTRTRRSVVGLTMVAAVLSVSACGLVSLHKNTTSPVAGEATRAPGTSTSASAAPAVLSVTPADQAKAVVPSTMVKVAVSGGSIDTVTVKDGKGAVVKGAVADNGSWVAAQRLRPSATYTLTASATNADGKATTTTTSFSTLKPRITATYGILYSGQTVGVGAPASIQFDSVVTTAAQRAQVEKAIRITTKPAVDGSWGWLDDRQLMWRPKAYWKPGTEVTVSAPLAGLQTGPDKWVGNDDSASFTVGDSMISTVNIKTHQMTVKRNGRLINTVPVSTGRPGPSTETRSGIKVIIAKEGTVVMDSATIGIPKGDPGYYRTIADDSLRVTWTGEYLHSAPWSVGSQGFANVSHGCVNLSPSNAGWMYDRSKVGDVVVFTGSDRRFLPTEGIGIWQYSYAAWQKQSALT